MVSGDFRSENMRFGDYHELSLYVELFVVYEKYPKKVFTTPLTRNTPSLTISTNATNTP